MAAYVQCSAVHAASDGGEKVAGVEKRSLGRGQFFYTGLGSFSMNRLGAN
jgi:hypothetical protein